MNHSIKCYLRIVVISTILFFSYGGVCYSRVNDFGDAISLNSDGQKVFPVKENSIYYLKRDIDLGGGTFVVPEGVTIVQKRGCIIKNGILIGHNTKVKYKRAMFDHVTIDGTWNVSVVSTKMFKDLTYTNALRDVLSLCNPEIENEVVIGDGHYTVKIDKSGGNGLTINSNTHAVLNGTIEMIPNAYKRYHILYVAGDNISIEGKGTIIGDKDKHTGSEGEWGMGVNIVSANNCQLSGLTIQDCWGDCIYIGSSCSSITLSNMNLFNGRRQGISITGGSDILAQDIVIKDVFGTAPGYAIDIEPNKQNHIKNVRIKNVTATNCDGGFVVSVQHPNEASVDSVTIDGCTINSPRAKSSLRLNGCSNIEVLNSTFKESARPNTCNLTGVSGVVMINNTFHTKEAAIDNISTVTFKNNVVYGKYIFQPVQKKKEQKPQINMFENNKLISTNK